MHGGEAGEEGEKRFQQKEQQEKVGIQQEYMEKAGGSEMISWPRALEIDWPRREWSQSCVLIPCPLDV